MLVPIAAVMFAFGYLLQESLINPFITRPEHRQFLLLVAIAMIIVNVLLIVFGPDAQNVQVAYAFDSFQIGPLIIDATKLYAGHGGDRRRRGLFAFFRYTASARRSAPAPTTTPARWWSGSTSSTSTRSPSASARLASARPAPCCC